LGAPSAYWFNPVKALAPQLVEITSETSKNIWTGGQIPALMSEYPFGSQQRNP
jgi:hypothetical protein